MEPAPRFRPELFAFLTDLAGNNQREWFHENKARYDLAVREPALDFIEAFRPKLHSISTRFEANARAQGGSLFRINRDTRFGNDKTPYKTNTGMHFRHERAKDAHAPGFYLHLEPRASFMGLGLWRPEPKVAYAIRTHMFEHGDEWLRITTATPFAGQFTLGGDRLTRPPKGFAKDHPLIDDLRRKDFIATKSLTQGEITKADFMDRFESYCRAGSEFVAFLCAAVGVPY